MTNKVGWSYIQIKDIENLLNSDTQNILKGIGVINVKIHLMIQRKNKMNI